MIYRYNFNKVAQYKQLTLEEAEEKMKNRRKSAEGYQRWMMKVANNGAAAFGEVEKIEGRVGGAEGGRRKKGNGDEDEDAALSEKGEEDEEEELARKSRLGLNRKEGDDDEEGPRGGDLDFDDDDIEKGMHLPFCHDILIEECVCCLFVYNNKFILIKLSQQKEKFLFRSENCVLDKLCVYIFFMLVRTIVTWYRANGSHLNISVYLYIKKK